MNEDNGKPREIDLGDDCGVVVVRANGAQVTIGADGHVTVSTRGGVELRAAANDEVELGCVGTPEPQGRQQIGAIESTGEHQGEIYGGILPSDNKPVWFMAAPRPMNHYNAAAWAEGRGGSLPTRKQGDYLTTLKGKGGAFTEIFNRGNSFPAGSVWLAERNANGSYVAWCQRLSDGGQFDLGRGIELPVLCVRR